MSVTKNIVVDVLTISEESSDSDDEVQYVPYTKPPPPLIDLLDNDGEDSETCDEEEVTRTETFNTSSVIDPSPSLKTTTTTTTSTDPSSQTSTIEAGELLQNPLASVDVDLQTALLGTLVVTDEDDDDDNKSRPSYIPSKWTSGMVKFYDCTTKDIRLSRILSKQPDNPALWKINEQELSANKKIKKRLRCFNCNEIGHIKVNCTEKLKKIVCHLCGEEGHGGSELDLTCPNAICLNCGRKQPNVSTHGCPQCTHDKNKKTCEICKVRGHTATKCPDNWRRFFSTTTLHQEDETRQQKQLFSWDKPVYRRHKDSYCANCCEMGHTVFHCLSETKSNKSNKAFIRQNPRILEELPQQFQNADDEIVEIITPSEIKCMDPECQNMIPKLNTFCLEIVVKSKEHQLLQKAQEENKINSSIKPNDQVSIIHSRNAIHIYSQDTVQARKDVLKLISKLNIESRKNSLPELITLDDNDTPASSNNNAVGKKKKKTTAATTTTKTDQLTVALLESEWDMILAESRKPKGLISRLTEKFNVNFYISKNNLMITIENGTEENRKLAQKNVRYWFECKAVSTKYVMQLDLGESSTTSIKNNSLPSQTSTSTAPNKRPHSPPPPILNQTRCDKKQKLDNPNLIPIVGPPRKLAQKQNDSFDKEKYLSNPWIFNPMNNYSNRQPQQGYNNDDGNQNQPPPDSWANNMMMGQENHPNYCYPPSFFHGGQQIPFQNYGGGFFNDYSIPPSEFHPSFQSQRYFHPGFFGPWPPGGHGQQSFNSLRFNFGIDNNFRTPNNFINDGNNRGRGGGSRQPFGRGGGGGDRNSSIN